VLRSHMKQIECLLVHFLLVELAESSLHGVEVALSCF
jgi:hypothetical protein